MNLQLETDRLILRPFRISDAKDVQRLAGHPLVAKTTATIPHPYPDGAAESWIGSHAKRLEEGSPILAMTLKSTGELIGAIDLFGISKDHSKAEMGYWVAVPQWGKGYCTEAARELIRYGFDVMGLNRIFARHVDHNPSSGRVMVKAGMKKEGTLRQDFSRKGKFYDIEIYAILRQDFKK